MWCGIFAEISVYLWFFWDFYGEKTPSEVDEGVHACP
jgi:hypothetical protein